MNVLSLSCVAAVNLSLVPPAAANYIDNLIQCPQLEELLNSSKRWGLLFRRNRGESQLAC